MLIICFHEHDSVHTIYELKTKGENNDINMKGFLHVKESLST